MMPRHIMIPVIVPTTLARNLEVVLVLVAIHDFNGLRIIMLELLQISILSHDYHLFNLKKRLLKS